MKFSPNEPALTDYELQQPDSATCDATPTRKPVGHPARKGVFRRLRDSLADFKADMRVPLPGQDRRSRFARFTARVGFILKRHGWKLVAAVVIYYFIRDTVLYIIIPYFLARQVFG